MVLGQGKNREAFGHVLLQPCSEFRGGIAVICDQFGQGGFGLARVPAFQTARNSVPMRLRIVAFGA